MRNEGGTVNCDSSRSAIDRRAVTAAGQLLMSAIWLEHRVRRVSTLFTLSSGQRASAASVLEILGCASIGQRAARSWRSERPNPSPIKRKVRPMTLYTKVGYGTRLVGSDLVHGRPLRTYQRGRTCMVEGCDIRLSVYNPKTRCSLHDRYTY